MAQGPKNPAPAFNGAAPGVVLYRSGVATDPAFVAALQAVMDQYYPGARISQSAGFPPPAPGSFGK